MMKFSVELIEIKVWVWRSNLECGDKRRNCTPAVDGDGKSDTATRINAGPMAPDFRIAVYIVFGPRFHFIYLFRFYLFR